MCSESLPYFNPGMSPRYYTHHNIYTHDRHDAQSCSDNWLRCVVTHYFFLGGYRQADSGVAQSCSDNWLQKVVTHYPICRHKKTPQPKGCGVRSYRWIKVKAAWRGKVSPCSAMMRRLVSIYLISSGDMFLRMYPIIRSYLSSGHLAMISSAVW